MKKLKTKTKAAFKLKDSVYYEICDLLDSSIVDQAYISTHALVDETISRLIWESRRVIFLAVIDDNLLEREI